ATDIGSLLSAPTRSPRRADMAKVLIANRGEIACRITTVCRRLGLDVAAIYSEADADALHFGRAAGAILIGPSAPARRYLDMDAILASAQANGADVSALDDCRIEGIKTNLSFLKHPLSHPAFAAGTTDTCF